jgi:hypothetical protein
MEFTTITAPVYAAANKSAIKCTVTVEGIDAPFPFVATGDDPEAHGSALFADLIEGKHGTISPFIAPPVTQAQLESAVQKHLDATAKLLGYDSIATAVTYADEPAVPSFQAQGKAFRAWRSQVWASCIASLDAVQAGTQPMPTAEALIATLPVFTAP